MFKVVVFDAYGTLFDVHSVAALAGEMFPGQGAAISTLWRDKQIEYTRLISLSDPVGVGGSRHYLSFWELTRRALQYTLARLQLDSNATTEDRLMAQYAQLSAYPENLQVLQALKARNMPTAILSNGSPDMLASAVESGGMQGMLQAVLSVEAVRQFKTAPQSYDLVLQAFPVTKAEVLFVSSNAWDALGASWFGFQALWVNRQGLPPETIGPPPAFVGTDLRRVLELTA